jgi:hypothetical protein
VCLLVDDCTEVSLFLTYRAKEKRRAEELNAKVKALGAADDEVDDLAAWVAKTRKLEEEQKLAEREKANRMASKYDDEVPYIRPAAKYYSCLPVSCISLG